MTMKCQKGISGTTTTTTTTTTIKKEAEKNWINK